MRECLIHSKVTWNRKQFLVKTVWPLDPTHEGSETCFPILL